MEGEQQSPGHPPAGWYRDPENPDSGRPRWWDGGQWTDTYQPDPPEPTQAHWIGAVLLLVVPSVLNGIYDANHGETTSYGIGNTFGAIVWSALLALLFRWLYVRFSERQRRVWSPWVFVIAAVISTLSLLAAIAADARDETAVVTALRDADAECDELGAEPFPPLGRGLAYRRLSPSQEAAAAGRIPTGLADSFELRTVGVGARPVALLVVAAVGTDPADHADVRAGFNDRLVEMGAKLKSFAVGSGEGVSYGTVPSGEIAALAPIDCYMRIVTARDLGTARFLAGQLAGE
jgi:hypothetical protein